jgi:hypothetical protein
MLRYILYKEGNSYALHQISPLLFNKLLLNKVYTNNVYDNPNEDNSKFIAMPEFNIEQLKSYILLHSHDNDNLKEYNEILSIIAYTQSNICKYNIRNKLDTLLHTQSTYWQDNENCMLSLTENFNNRKFKYIKIEPIEENNSYNDYIKELYNNTSNVLDMVINLKYKYIIFNNKYNCNYSNEDITSLYTRLPDEYNKYSFLCNMISSKNHCHLILNNKDLLQISEPIFNICAPIFKYLIGYGWLSLRLEESLRKKKISNKDRFIFNLETANKLPIFPFSYDDINNNPYACILVANESLNLMNNCVGLNMIKDNYKSYYGVCDVETFKKRLNLFVNKKNEEEILKLIDWTNFAITGSVMTACTMKFNPLMLLFKTTNDINTPLVPELTDQEYVAYFEEYYKNSDIDLVCNQELMSDFIKSVDNLISKIDEYYFSQVYIKPTHTSSICISTALIDLEIPNLKKLFTSENRDNINTDYIKNNLDNVTIKKYFYEKYYIPWKSDNIESDNKESDKKGRASDYYKQYVVLEDIKLYLINYELEEENTTSISDYEKYIFTNDMKMYDLIDPTDSNDPFDCIDHNNRKNKLECKIIENIKFSLSHNLMHRTIEVFKSKNNNIFGILSNFHLDFVRAYWNGSTVIMLPSFISSMMIQLSTDYKYFASKHDPIKIINKYRSRNFGVILNKKEKAHMYYYNELKYVNNEYNYYHEMYSTNSFNWGPQPFTSEIFKVKKYECANYNNASYNTFNKNIIFVKDKNDVNINFNNLVTSELFKNLKCINDNGLINPLSIEYIKLFYKSSFPLQNV